MATGAAAHSGKQSYVYVSILDRGVEGRIEYPSPDLGASIGVDMPTDVEGVERVVDEHYTRIVNYTDDHFAIGDGSEVWATEFTGYDVIETESVPYVQIHYVVTDAFEGTPRSFAVTYDGIFHANPEKDALIIIEHDFGSATFGNEGTPIAGVSVERITQTIELEDVSLISSLQALASRGLEAVRYRADVIWFLLVLLIGGTLAAVDRQRQATAVPRLESAARRFAALFAVFALSHSATLWLATLGPIKASAATASTLAAVSLALIGVATIRRSTIVERVAVGILGIGPGLALAEMARVFGIDKSRPVLSMAFFNLGVELALLLIVALAAPTVLMLRRTPFASLVAVLAAALAAVVSVIILLEVVVDSTSPLSGVAYSLVRWPRSSAVALAALFAAAGIRQTFERRGTLRPVTGSSE